MKYEEKTLNRKEMFNGQIIQVCVDDVRLPDGNKAKRELVFHKGGVGIICFTAEGNMIFVRQFRKPIEREILEIPAGKIELGEQEPLHTAKRELEEETNYQAENWTLVQSMVLSPGFCNETMYIYEAKNLKKVENPLPKDEDEFLDLVFLDLAEAKAAVQSGDICDAKTLFAVQYWEMQTLKRRDKF
ncbi:NUDIX hydrolase [Vagococcus entomophilus]|uniref:ADP-ribose pyrophosphatase n=1 Tax=Vagococcus entomophilus TaxID=1160095 RepID=A0A430AIC2_9ENTE|nr:NUDIX hydrolase [Vagococcus entomophilus]RSU07753.1 ADP-ribose pyrophosphatase [Vagococcus entomophilus]